MRGYSQYIRPAGAAIAAVLAIGPTYSYAQEAAAPAASAPAEVMAGPPPASVPVIVPPQPVVQPTQSVDERIAAAVAASQGATACGPTGAPANTARGRAEPQRQQPTHSPTARAQREAATPAPTAQREQANPAPAPVETVGPTAREAAPVAPPVEEQPATASNAPNEALYWALGGGALVLLSLGGAAAFRRRRTDEEALAVAPTAPVAAEPVVTERVPVVEPVVQRAPAAAYTPTKRAPQIGSLEAMAAAPPSPENPFLTHSKRMRRARFLLAQAERGDAALHSPTTAPEPPQTIHAEPKMQTVYRLGGDRGRQMGFKPQTR